jgi:drug/metabolite transporter (DMT)-like permease
MVALLLSLFLYSLNNFLWKILVLRLTPLQLIWGRSTITFTLIWCVFLFSELTLKDLGDILLLDGWYYLVASICGLIGLWGMVQGLHRSGLFQLAVFQILIALLSAIGTAHFILIDWMSLLGAALVLVAFAFYLNEEKKEKITQTASLWFLLMTTGFVSAIFINWHLVQTNDVLPTILTQETFVFVITSLVSVLFGDRVTRSYKQNSPHFLLFGLVILAAIFFGAQGLKASNPFLISIISLIIPIITAVAGVLLLKEPWRAGYTMAVVLSSIGLVLILN